MDETRRAILRWMTGVMEARGWSAGGWARLAGVTATNLTRFLRDPVMGSLPSADTLARLARIAGSEPRFLEDHAYGPVTRVPVLTLEQAHLFLDLGRKAGEEFLAGTLKAGAASVAMDSGTSRRAFALRIVSKSLDAAGVLPRDCVVLEPLDVLSPQPGDVVVTVGDGTICGYRFFPPHLMPVSTDPDCRPTAIDRAHVAGVAVQVVRALRM
ncbi:XRE family transcriptional regulator [Azospirillum picis]|uniref:SOS-response transcriptional repressor LexA n=1 Tax=Azospirillum picis TaxID=488438 RepID=A0ABU0MH51_9PROT|nr:XRE family transcriptional regulator [Azospirillum picis]MBP2299029.1 SOS-response transcriptional repressor LexA [Azospirillum picis]MDQ0532729.1 SOS-response transcriptional repressor LexA [Azospirillum picis]